MTKYPYIIYDNKIRIHPIFKELTGEPFILDMSVDSDIFNAVDINDQMAFQKFLDELMKNKYNWGIGAYLENREKVLLQYPQMVEEKRFFHLGLDIIVPLGTPLHAPLSSIVKESGYEQGKGNYGAYVLLMHESNNFDTFYSFYGHLNKTKLPDAGEKFNAGEIFAYIGDFHENGNWFYHTHLQIITQKGLDEGYISKGYCSVGDLPKIESICPSPLYLFRTDHM